MNKKKSLRLVGALLALVMVFTVLPGAAFADGKTPSKNIEVRVKSLEAVDGVVDGIVDLNFFIKEGGKLGELVIEDEHELLEELRPATTPNCFYYKFKGSEGPGENIVTAKVPVIMPEDSTVEGYDITIVFGPEETEEPETETVTLSFDPNGGSGSMESVEAEPGAEVTIPENGFTAPAGMIFDGWDLGEAGDKLILTEDTVAKAMWRELKTFSVTASYDFNDEGETPVFSETKTFFENEKPVFKAIDAPERKCYNFKGWGYENQLIAAGAEFTANADLTLTAQWELKPLKTYTILFDANGGKDAPPTQTGESRCGEVAITLSDKAPTNGDMKFAGWSLSKTEPKPILQPGGVAIVNDQFPTITLYAVWLDPNANPQTGDGANPGLWAALMSVSAIGLGAAFYFKKKRHI